MEAAVLKKVDARAYVGRFLDASTRPDGRTSDAFRKTTVTTSSIGPAAGSAMAKLGRTTVVAGVTARLVAREAGVLQITAEASALDVRGARLRNAAASAALASWVKARVAQALPEAELAAAEGVWWELTLALYVLDDAGNVRDAALLAAGAALADTALPAVKAAGDDAPHDALCCVDEGDMHRVLLERMPRPVSFAFIGGRALADPALDEEMVADTMLTVLVAPDGSLFAVVKPGGVPLPHEALEQCVKLASKRGRDLSPILNTPPPT